MFDLDHAAIMGWITDTWSMINTGGYASLAINFISGLGVVMVFKALFSGGSDQETADDG